MKPRTIVFSALTFAACGVIWLVLQSAQRAPAARESRARAAPPPPVATPPQSARFTMEQLYTEARTKAGVEPAASAATSSPGVEDALAEVLASAPQLRQFYELRRKALRTSAEQQDYLAMVSDPMLIEDARAELLAALTAGRLDQHDELARLQRIQFLNSALAWADNPARAHAVEVVSAVVMAELPADIPSELGGSVLGDKFDLFQLLLTSDPEQARALLAQARGTSAERILRFAWQTYWAGQSGDPPPS